MPTAQRRQRRYGAWTPGSSCRQALLRSYLWTPGLPTRASCSAQRASQGSYESRRERRAAALLAAAAAPRSSRPGAFETLALT